MLTSLSPSTLPVAVVGAGPVGLAAAAHLDSHGIDFILLEAGASVGAAMRDWGHVQLFSPWEYNIDAVAARLLQSADWSPPAPDVYPTGEEVVSQYLEPLSQLPAIASRLKLSARVIGITRQGRDKMKSDDRRSNAPFRIRFETPSGENEILVRAVIDTAGTWRRPNPLGSEGMPARGERALQSVVRYGIPDVLGRERSRYASRRVMVAGSGHSAFNVIVDLTKLAEAEPATTITWVVRRDSMEKIFGGGENDKLAARGALGLTVRRLLDAGRLQLVPSFATDALERRPDGIIARAGERVAGPVDEIVVATGFRPDFSYLSELQVSLDPRVESTPALAPMIDPNLHSCGTVRPHGHRELAHPEKGFYIAGMKSYGRAPTFLMRTGYEQVRSIVAALAGDLVAADRVELVLPETGVCSLQRDGEDGGSCCGTGTPSTESGHGVETIRSADTDAAAPDLLVASAAHESTGCCGGKPVSDETACCRKDEAAKAAGAAGCGCGGGNAATKDAQLAVAGSCCG